MSYNIKLEIEIQKLGFKRRWLTDKSGYWFEKKFKLKDLKSQFIIETDHKLFQLEIMTYEIGYDQKMYAKHYHEVAKFKCDIKTIKQTLKKYK